MPPPDIMAQLGPGFDPRSETWIFARHRVGDYYHHLNFSCAFSLLAALAAHILDLTVVTPPKLPRLCTVK